MLAQTFIDDINDSYNKKLSDTDVKDIMKFIHDKELSTDQIQNWYNVIKRKHRVQYTPVFGQLMDYWEEAKFMRVSSDSRYHSQSPLQMLIRYQNKSAVWLIQKCREIRQAQDKRDLLSREISFLVIWERLRDVIEHKQEEAKERIIANCDNELRSPVNLNDISIDYKPVKLSLERKGNVHISNSIGGI